MSEHENVVDMAAFKRNKKAKAPTTKELLEHAVSYWDDLNCQSNWCTSYLEVYSPEVRNLVTDQLFPEPDNGPEDGA